MFYYSEQKRFVVILHSICNIYTRLHTYLPINCYFVFLRIRIQFCVGNIPNSNKACIHFERALLHCNASFNSIFWSRRRRTMYPARLRRTWVCRAVDYYIFSSHFTLWSRFKLSPSRNVLRHPICGFARGHKSPWCEIWFGI